MELKPCEAPVYIHVLSGGPHDGERIPNRHPWESLRIGDAGYVADGKPEIMGDHEFLEILLAIEDDERISDTHDRFLYFKVPMKWVATFQNLKEDAIGT